MKNKYNQKNLDNHYDGLTTVLQISLLVYQPFVKLQSLDVKTTLFRILAVVRYIIFWLKPNPITCFDFLLPVNESLQRPMENFCTNVIQSHFQ